jgi:hypothetical protein
MEYDVQQREAVALNPLHNLACLDLAALMIISTCPSAPAAPAYLHHLWSIAFHQMVLPLHPGSDIALIAFGAMVLDIFHLNAKRIELQLATPSTACPQWKE